MSNLFTFDADKYLKDSAGEPVLVRMSDVQPESVSWLWQGRLPRGKLVILDGDPGLGKSTLTLDIAARISREGYMPDGSPGCGPANIIILTAEDGLADTVRPRLDAMGADQARITVLTAARDADGKPQPPSIPDHIETLRRAIQLEGAVLIIVDPVMAYLSGRVDSHRDQDSRSALRMLADLAESEGVCVLAVRHLRKTAAGNALYRGSGSIAFIAAARVGLVVAADPQDEMRRVLAVSKCNLAPIAPTLGYQVVAAGESCCVEWLGVVDASAADVLAAAEGPEDERHGRREAEAWLRDLLSDGPVSAKDVRREAQAAGMTWATVRRAQVAAGIRAHRVGGLGTAGAWYWEMPTKVLNDTLRSSSLNLSALGKSEHLSVPTDPADCPHCGRDSCAGDCQEVIP